MGDWLKVAGWCRGGRVVAAGGLSLVFLAGCFGGGEPEVEPSPSDVSEVFTGAELADASFWLAEEGMPTELVSLTDGEYRPSGSGGDDRFMRVVGDLVYVDIDGDGDGDRDAVALLEWVVPGGVDYTGWKGLYAWLWEDGEVVPAAWPLSWQWTCAEVEDEFRFELPHEDDVQQPVVMVYRQTSNACGVDQFGPAGVGRTTVGIQNGFPVRYPQFGSPYPDTSLHVSATVACERATTDDVSEVSLEGGVPLLWPEDGSPSVTEGYVGLAVWDGELSRTDSIELHNGYVPVWVEWEDSVGCGWLKWDFNEPA